MSVVANQKAESLTQSTENEALKMSLEAQNTESTNKEAMFKSYPI